MLKNLSRIFFIAGFIMLLFTHTSSAQGTFQNTGGTFQNDGTSATSTSTTPTDYGFTVHINNPLANSGISDISTFIAKIIDIITMIVTPFIVLCLIYAGFQYVTAGGDPGKVKKAHEWLLWTVVGAAVILGAWVIAHAIAGTVSELAAP